MRTRSLEDRRGLLTLVLGLVLTLLLAACGGGDDGDADDSTDSDASEPAAVGEEPTEAEPEEEPEEEEAAEDAGAASEEGSAEEADTPATSATVTVGYLASVSLAPAYVADFLGCYDAEGLEVEFSSVSPADAIALLAEGQIDVYSGAPSAAMFNQVAAGGRLALVATHGTIGTPDGEPAPAGLFVRTELMESGEVTEVADLAGRRVSLFGEVGTAASYQIGRMLAEGGLTFNDVELVNIPFADAVTALENGGVDAAFLTSPYTAQAVDLGVGEPIVDPKEVYGEDGLAGIVYGPNLLEDNREAGAAFLRANICAAERLQGDYRQDDEIVEGLAAFLDAPEENIRNGALYAFDPELTPTPGTLERMQEMFLAHGGILTYDEIFPDSELIATDLRDEALSSS